MEIVLYFIVLVIALLLAAFGAGPVVLAFVLKTEWIGLLTLITLPMAVWMLLLMGQALCRWEEDEDR